MQKNEKGVNINCYIARIKKGKRCKFILQQRRKNAMIHLEECTLRKSEILFAYN